MKMGDKLICMNPYITCYTRDYPKWPLPNMKQYYELLKVKNTEYNEPIAESFKNYLCLQEPCPSDGTIEETDPFYDKAEKKYSCVKRYFEKPLSKEVIKKDFIYQGRTEYQVTYCDLVKEVEDKEYRRKNAVKLPMDTNIPLTSNLACHREPRMINSRVYETRVIPGSMKTPNNLDPDHKIRKILETKTGATEYMGVIGKLGKEICVKQLHGVIERL